jgi:hypothetical protein
MLPPIPARFIYFLPFYFVFDGVGALLDKAVRDAIGGAARFYWWSHSVYWWNCSVYGGAARSFPQAIETGAPALSPTGPQGGIRTFASTEAGNGVRP